MAKNQKPKDYIPEPILQINEFEEETESVLELAKEQAAKIVQETKDRAKEVMQEEKENVVGLEKESLKNLEEEIKIEKENFIQKSKDHLQRIENIPEAKIKQAVSFVLRRVIL